MRLEHESLPTIQKRLRKQGCTAQPAKFRIVLVPAEGLDAKAEVVVHKADRHRQITLGVDDFADYPTPGDRRGRQPGRPIPFPIGGTLEQTESDRYIAAPRMPATSDDNQVRCGYTSESVKARISADANCAPRFLSCKYESPSASTA